MGLRSRIRDRLARRLGVPEIPSSLERLSRQGFQPPRILDVGAYNGGFARTCLNVWPHAKIVCFEAIESRARELDALADRHVNIHVIRGLVGAVHQENVALNEAETASSVLSEHVSQGFPQTFHTMRPLDLVVRENFPNESNMLLKIDVQGYELEVLKGVEQSLPKLGGILAEVNLLDIHKNVALLAETVGWLHARGWGAFDVCELHRRPLDRALWQMDFFFVPYNSPLRADKRWNS